MAQRLSKYGARPATTTEEADTVLAACRLLVGVSVRSLVAVEDTVDVTQLRILVVLASRGASTLGQLAAATGLHQSTASRACDRLVRMGFVQRMDDPADRRSLRLTLSERGQDVVDAVAQARRDAVTPILRRMSRQRRRELVSALEEFTAAGGEPEEIHLWSIGWATA